VLYNFSDKNISPSHQALFLWILRVKEALEGRYGARDERGGAEGHE